MISGRWVQLRFTIFDIFSGKVVGDVNKKKPIAIRFLGYYAFYYFKHQYYNRKCFENDYECWQEIYIPELNKLVKPLFNGNLEQTNNLINAWSHDGNFHYIIIKNELCLYKFNLISNTFVLLDKIALKSIVVDGIFYDSFYNYFNVFNAFNDSDITLIDNNSICVSILLKNSCNINNDKQQNKQSLLITVENEKLCILNYNFLELNIHKNICSSFSYYVMNSDYGTDDKNYEKCEKYGLFRYSIYKVEKNVLSNL